MPSETPNTQLLLQRIDRGEPQAKGQLLDLLYRELRGLAQHLLAAERRDHVLQPTALVHEAFLKLVDQTRIGARDSTHFKAIAARSMRQVLIDYARAQGAAKRGANPQRVTLTGAAIAEAAARLDAVDLIALEEALTELARLDPRKAQVVEMRFFGGLSIEEVAEQLGSARSTITDDWRVAKAWLAARLGDSPGS